MVGYETRRGGEAMLAQRHLLGGLEVGVQRRCLSTRRAPRGDIDLNEKLQRRHFGDVDLYEKQQRRGCVVVDKTAASLRVGDNSVAQVVANVALRMPVGRWHRLWVTEARQ
ncbi:hypothetical protein S245_039530 [Arachis hypogaea]